MCLALPARVIEVVDGRALVETASGQRHVSCAPLPDLAAGEHVLVSLGMAVQRISEQEAREIDALWAELATSDAAKGGVL